MESGQQIQFLGFGYPDNFRSKGPYFNFIGYLYASFNPVKIFNVYYKI